MWSWILAFCGIIGTFIVGRKNKAGWVILFFNETLWIVYALHTRQYGFILGSIAYMLVYIKNHRHWSKDHKSNDLSVLCYNCGGTYKVKQGEKLIHKECIHG